MRRSRLSIPISLTAHGLLIGGLILATRWATQGPPEPPDVIPAIWAGPAPPLGDPQGGAGEPHREAASSPKIEVPAQEPQQVTEPRDEQAVESNQNGESSNEAPGGESSGGQRPGPRGVPDGGTPDGTGKPEEPSIGNSPAIPVGGNVIAPVLLERAEPLYPEAMRKTHTEGLVFLQAVISQSGFVEDVRIVKSANPLFDAAAAAALRRWRYKPATLNGKAVRVYLTVSVRFHLH